MKAIYIRVIILFIVVVVILAAAWFIAAKPAPFQPASFSSIGNLVKNTPGLKPDTWYLAYEKPGFPGLTAELLFDDNSQCWTADVKKKCSDYFLQGNRVKIDGISKYGVVMVQVLTEQPEEVSVPVRLYYYDQKADTDAQGNILCSKQGLVAVNRVLPKNTTVEDVVKLLIRGEITAEEKAQGIASEYPLEGFTLASTTQEKGRLTLTFNDPKHRTTGGSCRVAVLWQQIETTAKQFTGATEVDFLPRDIFQP
jgi:hypothetical protein